MRTGGGRGCAVRKEATRSVAAVRACCGARTKLDARRANGSGNTNPSARICKFGSHRNLLPDLAQTRPTRPEMSKFYCDRLKTSGRAPLRRSVGGLWPPICSLTARARAGQTVTEQEGTFHPFRSSFGSDQNFKHRSHLEDKN